jgi:hypothetical protein
VTYTYHQRVLEELGRHGLRPLPTTSPERLREAVRDLYLFEIRRLRAELLRGKIVRKRYADHVIALRMKYPLLSLPLEQWVDSGVPSP